MNTKNEVNYFEEQKNRHKEGPLWGSYCKDMECYFEGLKSVGQLPDGFRISTLPLEFFPAEKKSKAPYKMNLSLILMDSPTAVFGAMFTRNKFPGAPVIIGRELLEEKEVQGIVVNNRISNVSAPNGVETALSITREVERVAKLSSSSIFPSSTGIIGWRLPRKEMIAGVPQLVSGLAVENGAFLARAIMTTDSFPKLRSVQIGSGRIVAVAKGAGMIEPNMATMLCFVMTDLDVDRDFLRSALNEAVEGSFNRISVDSDQSTSDSVIMLSSCLYKCPSKDEFKRGLSSLLKDLAGDVVRNGEGTAHVMRVTVSGFVSDEVATAAGKAVINSPLVKTAIFGNDPNVGRIISSLGDYCGNNGIDLDPHEVSVMLGAETVYAKGQFLLDEAKEDRVFSYLRDCQMSLPGVGYPEHDRFVEISISLTGVGSAVVLGSDLSYDYIKENAEYRS